MLKIALDQRPQKVQKIQNWSVRVQSVQSLFRYPGSQRENKLTPKIRLNKAYWAHIMSIYCLIDYFKDNLKIAKTYYHHVCP